MTGDALWDLRADTVVDTVGDLGYCVRTDCPNLGGVWRDCPRMVNGTWQPWDQ